jgi:probable rRNA maturation factor
VRSDAKIRVPVAPASVPGSARSALSCEGGSLQPPSGRLPGTEAGATDLGRRQVFVTSRRRVRGVRVADIRRDAARMLRSLGVAAELSVVLVDDAEIHRLNALYRHIDRSTDVLAFAMREGDGATLHAALLGDVVISLDTAARQAAARAVAVADEVRLLLAHGVLHLLGYDHERSPAEARRMFRRQRQLLAALG